MASSTDGPDGGITVLATVAPEPLDVVRLRTCLLVRRDDDTAIPAYGGPRMAGSATTAWCVAGEPLEA